jgi:hypothetical protein
VPAGSCRFEARILGCNGLRRARRWRHFGPVRHQPERKPSVRGERWFFVARDTVSFLGATGGRFGINNETTLGGGLFWERVNASAGLSLAAFSLPVCGPRLCGQMGGLVPGASVRLDLFGPYLSGGLGVAVDCALDWIAGSADAVWSGVSVRCSAGPILRFTTHP